jgi:hypothetical protein
MKDNGIIAIFLFFLFFICFVTFAAYVLLRQDENGQKCLENPFTFGAEKYSEKIESINCECTFFDKIGRKGKFFFNENGFYTENYTSQNISSAFQVNLTLYP